MRASGILMHITSLPGKYGVGTLGKNAFAFADFLQAAGQKVWQMLPVNPVGHSNSPYHAPSSFAGNPNMIDLEALEETGLLLPGEAEGFYWGDREDRVDFGAVTEGRRQVLRLAFGRFSPDAGYTAFCRQQAGWLSDYSLFCALKDAYDGKPWYHWPDGLKRRDPDALWQARHAYEQDIYYYKFLQYLFSLQFGKLKGYCRSLGIRLMGDVPIYVPYDSVEVWSHPELFQLNAALEPTAVAGCPPDAFSADGQLWGNPLYNWSAMEKQDFGWYIQRLSRGAEMFDMLRFDHFRGLESYWSVPAGDTDARGGHWEPGPGIRFVNAVKAALPELEIIAEDLGDLTPEVRALQQASGWPGMRVLEFAFREADRSTYLPHCHTANSVCYIGTHDNMTLLQWYGSLCEADRRFAQAYLHLDPTCPEDGVVDSALGSVCDLCILQMQDVLKSGAEARMNYPGTVSPCNWSWRARRIPTECAENLRIRTQRYGR